MATRTQPEQHAPPVQRLRIKYAKRGRARFTSHRDFGRAFERALRRAAVPMAYSSGFSPHPRISYANAAPTGAASEAEYLEIGLAAACDPAAVQAALDAALPPGLDIVEVVESRRPARWPTGSPARAGGPTWSACPPTIRAPPFAPSWPRRRSWSRRMTKNGLREFDARGAVVSLEVAETGLTMTLAHGVPLVRPDDVLNGLTRVWPPSRPPRCPC